MAYKTYLLVACLLGLFSLRGVAAEQLTYRDPSPQRYELTARASQIDPRTQEHPEIDFVFERQGKPADTERAMVDTRVPPQGKLVIWLMGYNQLLFERCASYGLHAVQVHYANGWFGKLSKLAPADDDQYLGKIRLEAATGDDFSPAVAIPKPDGMMERALQWVCWLADKNPQGSWDFYLSDDRQALRWDRVIIAGSSHGSTTAARAISSRRGRRCRRRPRRIDTSASAMCSMAAGPTTTIAGRGSCWACMLLDRSSTSTRRCRRITTRAG
jgi:hypothetical protein